MTARRLLVLAGVAWLALACGGGGEPSLRRGKAVPFSNKVATRTPFQQAVLANPGCGSGQVPRITFRKQDTDAWCWAASGQMALQAFGKSVEQCTLVNDFCERDDKPCKPLDCCATPKAKDCLTGGWPPMERHDVTYVVHPGALEPEAVVRELGCNKRPFLFAWKDSGGSGHMMVAIDFTTTGGKDYVVAHDPFNGEILINYSTYRNGNLHWDDLIELKKVGS